MSPQPLDSASPQAPSLKLKPNAKSRALTGHPWVFANEVETLLPAEHDGEVIDCRDRAGRRMGSGIYNSRSQICWRRLSRERVTLDEAYLRDAITRAIARRDALPRSGGFQPPDEAKPRPTQNHDGALRASGGYNPPLRRLIWSESDDLPGIVLDQFGDTLVLQIQTLAMEKRRDFIARLLMEDGAITSALTPRPAEIIFRDDAPIRRLEGLPQLTGTFTGKNWEPRWMRIDGFDYWLDLLHGQKTGFYLDQRAQHALVARHAKGRRVLDAFCNQGPFALHCARAGATSVLGLDSAEDAIAQARQNAARNLTEAAAANTTFQVANVFDFFNDTSPERRAEQWDMIILDPPPFAKSKSAMEGAMRGYKEINLRAMQHLAQGGILATYTCSHHMHDTELRQVLAEAAADARRRARVLEFCHQPPDHPVLVTMPESEYLRGYILCVE